MGALGFLVDQKLVDFALIHVEQCLRNDVHMMVHLLYADPAWPLRPSFGMFSGVPPPWAVLQNQDRFREETRAFLFKDVSCGFLLGYEMLEVTF